ncbi:Hypothetical predicted protein [Marmota monax]|uniref:Uncharacterized protein n=1 Tax=Marmota monax TaxID=9995 RepID=A0A5E4C735_MARMO|nr:hypothetical protein GHT09_011053 [Marmota monax]VTJ77525.1 Hypothetical predicted protein [Marmota monax]
MHPFWLRGLCSGCFPIPWARAAEPPGPLIAELPPTPACSFPLGFCCSRFLHSAVVSCTLPADAEAGKLVPGWGPALPGPSGPAAQKLCPAQGSWGPPLWLGPSLALALILVSTRCESGLSPALPPVCPCPAPAAHFCVHRWVYVKGPLPLHRFSCVRESSPLSKAQVPPILSQATVSQGTFACWLDLEPSPWES